MFCPACNEHPRMKVRFRCEGNGYERELLECPNCHYVGQSENTLPVNADSLAYELLKRGHKELLRIGYRLVEPSTKTN